MVKQIQNKRRMKSVINYTYESRWVCLVLRKLKLKWIPTFQVLFTFLHTYSN